MADDRLHQLAELLAAQGVRHAFGVTGSGPTLSLIAALERQGVAYHPASHEAAAAMMAGGATAAGVPAVCLAIKGPGLANLLPGIAANAFENRPVLSISEAFGPATPSFRKHKRLDHVGLLSPVTKGSLTLDRVSKLQTLLEHAREEVPGPVHLDLADGGAAVPLAAELEAPSARESEVDSAARMLDSAQSPVVIAGSLALRRGYGNLLRQLEVPVFTTAAAKGLIDESSPHAAGVYTGDGKALSPEAALLPKADLVLGIGLRNTEVLSPKRLAPTTLLIDEVAGDLTDGFAGQRLVGDASVAQRLIRCLAGTRWGLEQLAAAKAAMRGRLLASGEWSAPAAIDALNRPPGVLSGRSFAVVADTGSFCTVAEHLLQAAPAQPWFGSNNGRYMGTGLPTAIGVAIAGSGPTRGRPVVCLVGDGGIRMHWSELRLAVAERLPLCVVLMSDGRFGSVACAAGALAGHRAVGVDGASWWQAAEAVGCTAVRADSPAAFESALAGWQGDAPLFIEAVFEPVAYAAMTRDLR